jgi:hypothetical protein
MREPHATAEASGRLVACCLLQPIWHVARFKLDEQSHKLRLPVCPGLFEHALQMHTHRRETDVQLVGGILQPIAAKDAQSNRSFRRRQIKELSQAGRRQTSPAREIDDEHIAAAGPL